MISLETEFAEAVCNINAPRLAELQAAGIPEKTIAALTVGMAPIEAHRGGLFEIAEDGPLAVLVPCGFWDGLNWQLDDICSFYLNEPKRWWLRLGAGSVLGDLYRTSLSPSRIEPTPLAWLQGGATGFCILDWHADPLDLLAGAGELVANTSLMNRLRQTTVKAATARLEKVVNHG